MRWIAFLSLYILAGLSLAWPLDLGIDHLTVRSDDVSGFDIHTMDMPTVYPKNYIIPISFNDSAKLDIYFAVGRNVNGLNMIDTNGMRLNPERDVAPIDLVAHGSYNASIGGRPGTVTWMTYTEGRLPGQDNYVTANTEIVGITSANGTEIAMRSKESFPTHRMSEEEISARIVEMVDSFNRSLEKVEVDYRGCG
ncbi:MAG: hypothetical protein QM438_00310 [Euryarchaeota archaeon]|jgi:hypothetical protein|nr:hypothetical protein [Euryarchaeota archaeon]